MDTTRTPTTLRARLIANSAVKEREAWAPAGSSTFDDDPFAGDDILWADEDWTAHAAMDEESGLRFCFGLLVGLAVSAAGWVALVGSAYLAYRLIN
jgi:hypothetical protein